MIIHGALDVKRQPGGWERFAKIASALYTLRERFVSICFEFPQLGPLRNPQRTTALRPPRRYTSIPHGRTFTSPRRTSSRIVVSSGGSRTSTSLPQMIRCQAISTQPLAVNSTIKLPSGMSVRTWVG